MKKLLSLLVVVMMAFSLVACSAPATITETPDAGNTATENDPELQAFIDAEGEAFVTAFDESFAESSGGLTCSSTIAVSGTTVIITCPIDGINDIPEEVKAEMQAVYDETKDLLKEQFQLIKDEVPTLTNVIMSICEEDGDVLASLDIEF